MKQTAQNPWNSHMLRLQEAYRKEFEALQSDPEGRQGAQATLNVSTATYHDEVIGMGYLPKIYDHAALSAFEAIVAQTYTILDKITRHYLKDPAYRSLFRFSPLLEELTLLESGYDCTIPISRIDIFLDEQTGSFKFCEFNTDGSGAMNEDREVVDALTKTPLLQTFSRSHELVAQELFDPWIECFLQIYQSSAQAVSQPVVGIVDYLQSAVINEQLEFRNRFERAGTPCLVCDIASLEYKDGVLYGKDVTKDHAAHHAPRRLDALYRRAVTFELIQELQNSPEEAHRILATKQAGSKPLHGALALIAAVAEQKVCLIGSFATQVAHSKAIFCLLHHQNTQTLLTCEEQCFIKQHVPFTTWLKEDAIDIEAVKNSPEDWIIKPVDGYGTVGVHAGKSFDNATWSALIDEKLAEDYVIQQYCAQFQTLNTLPLPLENTALAPFNILTGLYCYGAKLGGVYVRAGQDALIVGFRGGVTLGSLLVDYQASTGARIRPRALLN
ncbi:MAG: hypothetical protein LBP91_03065 [Coriobacteriales bacterium]|jgi:hypothetical protein|nr:hypothetical protein [Coriobacteriales bacterium]